MIKFKATKMEMQACMPLWLATLIKLFCSYITMAPEEELKQIEQAIEEERYDGANGLIWHTEFVWGASPMTVRLSTRISRIQILAGYEE